MCGRSALWLSVQEKKSERPNFSALSSNTKNPNSSKVNLRRLKAVFEKTVILAMGGEERNSLLQVCGFPSMGPLTQPTQSGSVSKHTPCPPYSGSASSALLKQAAYIGSIYTTSDFSCHLLTIQSFPEDVATLGQMLWLFTQGPQHRQCQSCMREQAQVHTHHGLTLASILISFEKQQRNNSQKYQETAPCSKGKQRT